MKRLNLLSVLILSLLLVLVACGPSRQQVGVGEKVNWTLQTTWAQGWLLHEMAEDFARRVYEMSDGQFEITVLPAGAIVGGLEVLDATHAGTIDAFHSWTGYWMGKHPSAPFFSSIPMHFEPLMHVTWFYGGDGLKLMQEMYDEMRLNVVVIPCGVTHPEVLAHSNKPLASVQDWVGLKYRAPGWWGEILKKMGVAVTMLPGTELYPALQRGILDALEFSSPIVNRQQGFHEVTRFVAGPGMHQPTCMFEVGFNKDKYNALPDAYKAMLKTAAMATTVWSWSKDIVEGADTLEYWKKQGKQFTRVSPEAQREFRRQAWAYIDDDVKQKRNSHYTKTWKSVQDHWKMFVDYEDFMIPVRE